MKHMNRILALALALIMVLGLATTASAAAMEGELTGGSITVTNAIKGATYKAYQILYLDSFDEENDAYMYKANSEWAAWLATQTQYVAIDEAGYVTWVEGADVVKFAEVAGAALAGKSVAGTATAEANGAVTISGLNLGYYLVDTNIGALCSLDTTNPAVNVEEKNEVPDIKKEVKEDSDGSWGEVNDAAVNQIVEYKATVTVQTGAENYIIHDRMSAELDFVEITSITAGDATVPADKYTVTYNVAHGEGHKHAGKTCTFDIAFDNEYIADLEAGTEIVILYKGRLNESAVVKTANPNEIDMQYGDENDPEWTPTDITKTYTWDMNVIKVDGKDNEITLAGAKFKLTTDEEGENALKFHDLGDNKFEVCDDDACEAEHVTEFVTDENGNIYIEGIDAGTYYLHEIEAPAGYNKLTAPIEVKIEAAANENKTELSYETVNKQIENNAGIELPSTGGMGTTLFYAFGGLLIAAAVVMLVTKKRMASAK